MSGTRTLSLRWRLIGPLIGVWAVGLALLVTVLYINLLDRFRGLVEQRADTLVAAVYSAAETAREPADLRRFVSTLGAGRDVSSVTLLGGRPARVIAATDHGLHDLGVDELPDRPLAAQISRVILERKGERVLDAERRSLVVLEPVLLMGTDGEHGRLEDGVLALRLDATSLWRAARDTVLHLSVGLGAIFSAVALGAYLMLSRYVLRPVDGIRDALDRRAAGEADVPVPIARPDELGELARTLGELLDTLRIRNRQLVLARDHHLGMLESFPHLAWRAGLNGQCDWFNRAWLRFTGRALAQEVGSGWLENVHPDDRDRCARAFRRHVDAREPMALEFRLRHADGTYHWIASHGAPMFDDTGEFVGHVGSCYDLQASRDNAQALARMTRLYHALSATNKAIVHTRDADALLPQVCRIAVEYGELERAWIGFRSAPGQGWRIVAAHGRNGPLRLDDPALRCRLPDAGGASPHIDNDMAQGCGACGETDGGACATFPIAGDPELDAMPDGALFLRTSERNFFDVPKVALLEEMATDIGFALRNLQRDRALRLAARVFENNSEGIVVIAPDRRVVMINRAFTTLTGFTLDAVRNLPLALFDPAHHPADFEADLRDHAAAGEVWQGEAWLRRADGEAMPCALTLSAVRSDAGGLTHYVAVFSDISQRKADEARIRFLASHDFLTGLPSRAVLEPTVADAIAAATRSGRRAALCFLDLDRFKNVNDTLGHHTGDRLLVEVARRLGAVLQDGECLLRHGGDEFVVVMPEAGDRNALAAAAARLIGALDAPFELAGCEFSLSASIGVAVFPEDGHEPDTLLDRADAAMYRAKEAGRNAVEFFADGMAAPTRERLALELALRRALERQELAVHYQPLVKAHDSSLTGAEALLRWRHPELGDISPARFIPLAEESGLILPIGTWVLDTVCRDLAAWRAAGRTVVPVAVNLSALQFRRTDFVATVSDILHRHAIPAELLILEVTESMVMRDVERAAHQLGELKALGLSIAVDDFGTGYSSLAYLKRFPLDKLKVDQSFVREINAGPGDRAIVAAIVGLGHTLGLSLVAEGVETEEMAETLRGLGCDLLQGWLFGRAEPAAVFSERLAGALRYA